MGVRLPHEPPPSRELVEAFEGLSEEQRVIYHTKVGQLHHDDELPLIEAERLAYRHARRST